MRQRSIDVGLTTRSWGGWAWDVALSIAICAPFAAAATAVAIALMRRLPRRWWLPASGLVVAAGAAFVFAGPARDRAALQPFRRSCRRGARAPTCSSWRRRRASRSATSTSSTPASARPAPTPTSPGSGSSKRVVLYDTLLRDFDPRETRLVVAHELGHVRYHDVPRGLLYLLLVAPRGDVRGRRAGARLGGRARARSRGPQTVPALLAATALVAALVGTVSNQLSRRVEARADSFALGLTGDPGDVHRPAAAARRCRTSPTPTRRGSCSLLLGTHPTTVQRIGMGRRVRGGRAALGSVRFAPALELRAGS